MKFTKQDLLTLLIGLFLFSSCENTNTIGIEPEGDLAITGDKATIGVNSFTEEESTNFETTRYERYPLGYIQGDEIFGKTEASIVISPTLPNRIGYNFGKDAVVDSAILTLPYSTQFYGDTTTSVYSFNVEQLQSDLALEWKFPINKNWAVQGSPIGTFTGKVQPKTPVKIFEIVKGAVDTLKTIAPQIRISLNPTFIQNNILNVDSAARSTEGKFRGRFKGLKISVNKASTTGKGGLLFFDFAGSNANIEIYYKNTNISSSAVRDTLKVNFPIVQGYGPVATTIKHDYAGTPVKTQLDVKEPATPYQVTYLQAAGGLRNRITFPQLTSFVNTAKGGNANAKIVVNRAELVVNVSNGTDVIPFAPAQRLSLYRLDVGGERANIVDNESGATTGFSNPRYAGSEAAFGGFYDTTNKRYVFTVTGYIQDLIDGSTKDYGTFIAPSSLTEYKIIPSYGSGSRTVITTANPKTGDKPMHLNIYYTKVN